MMADENQLLQDLFGSDSDEEQPLQQPKPEPSFECVMQYFCTFDGKQAISAVRKPG